MAMLEKLKRLLHQSSDDSSAQEELLFCLEAVCDALKAYCNRDDIPPELENCVVRMAAGYYAACGFGSTEGESGALTGPAGAVTRIERGDVAISYQPGSSASLAASAPGGGGGVMELLNEYKEQLQRFRRFRWGGER